MRLFTDLIKLGRRSEESNRNTIVNYTVVDIETTGLYAEDNYIIDIAGIKVESNRPTKIFQSLLNYRGQLDSKIVSLTGIKSDELRRAPDRKYVLEKFQEFVSDDILVGHNIKAFDNKFLWFSFQHVNLTPLENPLIDTLELSRDNVPSDCHKLEYLCEMFNIKNNNAHRALYDAKATMQLFQKLTSKYDIKINPQSKVYEAESFFNIAYGDRKNIKYLVDEDPNGIESIRGKVFCVTTFMPFYKFKTENDLCQFIVNAGGKVGGLTLKTDYLIDCTPDYLSAKEKRAIDNVARGKATTQIISPEDFLRLAGC